MAMIWPALLVAPLLVLVNLSLVYALVTPACEAQQTGLLHLVAIVCLVIVVVLTALAWREMRRSEGDGAPGQRHFLALLATEAGALSALVIVAMWIPQWALSPCLA